MDLDDLLDEHGTAWRESQPAPPTDVVLASTSRPPHPTRARRTRLALAAVAVATVVVGIGVVIANRPSHDSSTVTAEGPTSTTGTAPVSADLQAALDHWASFPVDQSVRPLILEGGTVNAPASGFTSNGTKDAFSSGAFTDPATLPAAPAEFNGYPIVDPAEGLARLRADGDHQGTPAPLAIDDMGLGTGSFVTDRGSVSLPAWIVRFHGIADPAEILAVAPTALYTPPPEALHRPPNLGAAVAADDRTITLRIAGSAPGDGPCSSTYTADLAESSTAAAVEVHEIPNEQPTSTTAPVSCTAMAYPRTVTVTLSQPLGNRVLVDATTKSAVVVAPEN